MLSMKTIFELLLSRAASGAFQKVGIFYSQLAAGRFGKNSRDCQRAEGHPHT